MANLSYVDMLWEKLEHDLVSRHQVSKCRETYVDPKDKAIEPELIAMLSNLGSHNKIHPTRTTLGESLLIGYSHSSSSFLICNKVLEVDVDQEIDMRASARL